MCGISGYIHLNGKPISSNATNRRMLAAQKHRGPDDSGIRAFSLKTKQSAELPIHNDTSVSPEFDAILGFNRLSIMDLSPNGHQPMTGDGGQVILAMNGEVYNAFDYKPELKDYAFKGASDTEVVLALYLKYGVDGMLERLNGMFSIVLVDFRIDSVFVIRDRLGIKPMYYILNDDYFAFSSEFKSFYYLSNFKFELDESQLHEYLLFRSNVNGTLLKGVNSLDPGHYLTYKSDGTFTKTCFFDINNLKRTNANSADQEHYKSILSDTLRRSVNRQLMSDVKLGCQLSGGVDSSIVTYLANQSVQGESFESVSVVFDDERFSEEPFIDHVVNQLGIVSHKFLLDDKYYFDQISKATWHFESPINHPNTIGIFLLAQEARKHVTVLLSGEGADEVFGGYSRFNQITNPWKLKTALGFIRHMAPYPSRMADYLKQDNRAILATSFMPLHLANQLMPGFDFDKAVSSRKSIYAEVEGSVFDKQVKYEIKTYLPDLLIRQDKMSMAHSIENRVPFLDNEVIDRSFDLPAQLLMAQQGKKNSEKYILKLLTADALGKDFTFRDKMGFGIPLRQFFAHPEMTDYLKNTVLPGVKRRNIMNASLVENWINQIKQLKYSEIEALWIVVAFEIWAQTYLDGQHENWNTAG